MWSMIIFKPFNVSKDFVLGNPLFVAVKLTKF